LVQRASLIVIGLIFLGVISARFGELKKATVRRVEKMFTSEETMDARTSGRSDIVRVGWRMFVNQPWGIGTGNFKAQYAKASSAGYIEFKPGREVDAHAGWIKTLAENGLLGIALLAAFVGSFAYLGYTRHEPGLLSIGLLVTSVLALAFLSTEFQGKGLWFLATGALILLTRKRRSATIALDAQPVPDLNRTSHNEKGTR
jgi:O-antigen ligase